MNVTGQTVANM